MNNNWTHYHGCRVISSAVLSGSPWFYAIGHTLVTVLSMSDFALSDVLACPLAARPHKKQTLESFPNLGASQC